MESNCICLYPESIDESIECNYSSSPAETELMSIAPTKTTSEPNRTTSNAPTDTYKTENPEKISLRKISPLPSQPRQRTYGDYFFDFNIPEEERVLAGLALPIVGLFSLFGCESSSENEDDNSNGQCKSNKSGCRCAADHRKDSNEQRGIDCHASPPFFRDIP